MDVEVEAAQVNSELMLVSSRDKVYISQIVIIHQLLLDPY